ncbi:MAG: hypothetical protein EKK35_17830 [Bradyrhizobiaceae bacterium]|nr:MAG: hypothetical protein EKK35_17830 [Bradyrhizobiaceae bacterium]
MTEEELQAALSAGNIQPWDALLERLMMLATYKHTYGDVSSKAYKRTIAGMALGSAASLLRSARVPDHVPEALAEVAAGLDNLNRGIPSDVLTEPLAQNKTTSTDRGIVKADVTALLEAMVATSSGARKTTRAARSVYTVLGDLLKSKIAPSHRKADKPEKLLTNWLSDFRRGAVSDEIVAGRFKARQKMYIAGLSRTDVTQDEAVNVALQELRIRLEGLPDL